MDVWAEIEQERSDLADMIVSLDAAQLATGSLCEGWTVKHVAAHVLSIAVVPRHMLTLRMARNFPRFDKTLDQIAREFVEQPAGQLADTLRDSAASRNLPLSVDPARLLMDTVMHSADARRPLGIDRAVPAGRMRVALDSIHARSGIVLQRRPARGLRFDATDLEWSAGEGPAIRGPAESLLLALGGRMAGLRDLDGDGLRVLAHRIGRA